MVIRMLAVHPIRNLHLHISAPIAGIAGIESLTESTAGRARSLFLMSFGGLLLLIGYLAFYLSGTSLGTLLLTAAPVNPPPPTLPLVAGGILGWVGFVAMFEGWQRYRHWIRDLTRLFKKS